MTSKQSILVYKLIFRLLLGQSKISVGKRDKRIKEFQVKENNIFYTLIDHYSQSSIMNRMLGYYMRECRDGR